MLARQCVDLASPAELARAADAARVCGRAIAQLAQVLVSIHSRRTAPGVDTRERRLRAAQQPVSQCFIERESA